MNSSGGREPRDVLAILVWIVAALTLSFLTSELIDRDLYGEAFIGGCVLVAGFMVARAIRSTRR